MDSSLHFMKAFVFSDIVASTRLKNSLPGKTQADRDRLFIEMVLEPHRKLLENSLSEHKGRLVKTLGDGCFLVFDSPMRAALWAMDVQSLHSDTPIVLPDGQHIGVKIGIHHGEATLDPQDASDYSGRNVDYAARLVELATEGRIILSRSMYAQLEDAGIYGVEFHEHGERELRGIGFKTVYELLWDDIKPRPLNGDSRIDLSGPSGDGGSAGKQEVKAQSSSDVITKVTTGSTVGNYVLGRRLGSGAMGTVFEAEHPGMARNFAIKVIDDSLLSESEQHMVSRFYREIKAISRLNHPNIVRAHNASLKTDPVHYLVMEYLQGLSLDRVIVSRPVNWSIAAEVLRRAATGLDYIHQNELVHRDIKPSNLLVTYPTAGQESEIKILDLGLALLLDEDERETRFQNSIMGSAYYMSPEQWQSSEVDIRADIYSLGCTIYHLLTGRAPFQDSPYNQKYAHQNLPVPAIPEALEVPEQLQSIVFQMLAKEPAERYTTPEFLIDELSDVSNRICLSSWAKSFTDEATKSYISTERHSDTVDVPSKEAKQAVPTPKPWIIKTRDQVSDWIAAHPRVTMSVTVGIMVTIAGILMSGWITPSGIPKTVLADEMVNVTNINAAPSAIGDWWFDQTPWYTPAVRDELAKEIEQGGSAETQESISRIADYLDRGELGKLKIELFDLREQIKKQKRLGDAEYSVAVDLKTLNQSTGIDLVLSLLYLEQKLSISAEPREIHLLAVVRHKLSLSLGDFQAAAAGDEQKQAELTQHQELLTPSEYKTKAEDDYKRALDAYDSEDRLRVLALTDYARLKSSGSAKDKKDGSNLLSRALDQPTLENATLAKVLILCQQAEMFRKQSRIPESIATLESASKNLAKSSRADKIPENHPYRIAIDERLGWTYFEAWKMADAEVHFSNFIDQLDGVSNDAMTETEESDLVIYRSHANMGRAMVRHYSGRQKDALALYKELSNRFSQRESYEYRRRRINILDREADACIFGPTPDIERANSVFRSYNQLERNLTLPAIPIYRKNLRMCIALAQGGNLEAASQKLSGLELSAFENDAQAKTAYLLAKVYCGESSDIEPLLRHVSDFVNQEVDQSTKKPHPHLVQLLLLSTEVLATKCSESNDVDRLYDTTWALLILIDKLQTRGDDLNPLFERYLQSSHQALDKVLATQSDDGLSDNLAKINRWLD